MQAPPTTITSTTPRRSTSGASGGDRVDGVSLDMGPELSRQVLKNEALLQQAVTAKIAGFYFRLALMGVVTGVALVCLACGYDNPIWAMLITYILGAINAKDKAGKFVKSVISDRSKPGTTAGPVEACNIGERMSK